MLFRDQAGACARLGSALYAGILDRVADDLEAGGPSAVVLAGHENDPGPSGLALRLMGSVHRMVLAREAGALATYYPSVGGRVEPEGAWREVRALLEREPDAVRSWLDRAPQTNEVGRSSALLGGLHVLTAEADLPVRLLEIGSSGGLNLRCEHYACLDEADRVHGDADSPVRLRWRGPTPAGPPPRVAQRLGSDLHPIDVTTTEGRLALTAYVWADQAARLERLRGAFAVAGRVPAEVRAQGAGDFVEEIDLAEGSWTVLVHSVMWQYLARHEQERITAHLERLGERATATAPLAHLRAEPMRREPGAAHEMLVALTTWPEPEAGVRRILGEMPAHGTPTTWLSPHPR